MLFRLIYACGLRPNEGRNLRISDINFETGELFITKTKRRKERIVVALYYNDELTLKEIANILHLTEARISQLHTKAVFRLRGSLARMKATLL